MKHAVTFLFTLFLFLPHATAQDFYVGCASGGGGLKVWNAKTDEICFENKENHVVSLVISSDYRRLIAGGFHDKLFFGDTQNWELIRETKRGNHIYSVLLQPNAPNYLSSQFYPNYPKTYLNNINDDSTVLEYDFFYRYSVFSNDGNWVIGRIAAYHKADGYVGLIHIPTGKFTYFLKYDGGLRDVGFLPNGKTCYASDENGKMIFLNLESGKVVKEWETIFTNKEKISHASNSLDGKYMIIRGLNTNIIALYSIPAGKLIR
ncbi:MAG: hypothetical protein Q4C70_02935 [Planctomycetia bacterium]|nr:hypothetical protein [Planctomycetia bacterium]